MTEGHESAEQAIAVFGAYGHTAGFVAAELRRRGWAPILSGRDAARLRAAGLAHPGSEVRVATIDDPSSLDHALAGAAAVIYCAGPFADTANPTRGTRLTGERRAGRRVVFSRGRLEVRSGDEPPPTGTWEFPAPFGLQDVVGELSTADLVTISHHLHVQEIRACLNVAPISDLSDPDTPGPSAADDSGRSSQTFLVDVIARNGDEQRRTSARGRDIYASTAPIVVEAAERIVRGEITRTGVGAAGELFDAADVLAALSEHHLSVEAQA